MNTARVSPYLLCPRCKGRVRVDAMTPGGVPKCPVCQEAGLLAMYASGMGGGRGKTILTLAVLAAAGIAAWIHQPQQATAELVPQAASPAGGTASAPAASVWDEGTPLSSSIEYVKPDNQPAAHEVARLHRMASASAARMNEIRGRFADALDKDKHRRLFDGNGAKARASALKQSIGAATAIATEYRSECDQVILDLRLAISEAAVSEAARERGLGYLQTLTRHEHLVWSGIEDTLRDGAALAAVKEAAKPGTNLRQFAELNERWNDSLARLDTAAELPPVPAPSGLAAERRPRR